MNAWSQEAIGSGEFHQTTTAQQSEKPEGAPVVVVYLLAGLPVWRVDNEQRPHFDASIVVTHIKKCIPEGNWDESSRIVPTAERVALLVVHSPSIHAKVQMVLTHLREFTGHDLVERFRAKLLDAAESQQHILLFEAGPDSVETRQFFEARFDFADCNRRFQTALKHYVIQCASPDQIDLLRSQGLIAFDKVNSTRHGAIALLDLDGQLLARTDFAELATNGVLDRAQFAEFLDANKKTLEDARLELQSGLATASRENKRILVQISGPGCATLAATSLP